jgi:hypothetical protein
MAGLIGCLRPAGGGSRSRVDTWRPQSCPAPGGGSQSRGDTWRPWSCPVSGGRCWSPGDTWHPWSCPAPRGGCWSPSNMWQPRSCHEPGGGYHSTTPLPRPSVDGQSIVVPVTPPDDPHRMITRGKTGFRVVPDCLVRTAVTSSPTPSPIPSSARAALADPIGLQLWRKSTEP